MASSSSEDEDNYWPGYVDALTTMTMVLTFILMVLGIVVFSLSQSVSRAYLDAVAEAAGMPHPTSVEQSQAVIAQVVTLLREKNRDQDTGGLAAKGEGAMTSASRVVADRAESEAQINPAGNSVPAEKVQEGPAIVVLAEPDPVTFAKPTNGGVPLDPARPSGQRLTSASPETERQETANRPLWDPTAPAGHLTNDQGDAPLALAAADPVRSNQPGSGDVPAKEQPSLSTENPGKASIAASTATADPQAEAATPATQVRVALAPVSDVKQPNPGQTGHGDTAAQERPSLTSEQSGAAAVAGETKAADAPTDPAAPAATPRVDLVDARQPAPKPAPGQTGAGSDPARSKPSVTSDQAGHASVMAETASPADTPADATAPATQTRVALAPLPDAPAKPQPGQVGKGETAAQNRQALSSDHPGAAAVAGEGKPADATVEETTPALAPRVDIVDPLQVAAKPAPGQAGVGADAARSKPSVTSERSGRAAVAGDLAPADAEPASGDPATTVQTALSALPDQQPATVPGQQGGAEARAQRRPDSRIIPATPAPGDKIGTDKDTPKQGPAVAMLVPVPEADKPPLTSGPTAEDKAVPGGVPLSVRDKPSPEPSQVIESVLAPTFKQSPKGAEVTTAGAILTVRFKPRGFTLTDEERTQLRTFVVDLKAKGLGSVELEAVAAVSQEGFSDERRAAYSRMMVIRNELLAAQVAPDAIRMKVIDSLNTNEANIVKLKRL